MEFIILKIIQEVYRLAPHNRHSRAASHLLHLPYLVLVARASMCGNCYEVSCYRAHCGNHALYCTFTFYAILPTSETFLTVQTYWICICCCQQSLQLCSETAIIVLDMHLSVVCPLKVQFTTIAEDLTALEEL